MKTPEEWIEESTTPEGLYRVKDFYLVAAIVSVGFPIEVMQASEELPDRFDFYFTGCEDLFDVISQFNAHTFMVNSFDFTNALKYVRQEINTARNKHGFVSDRRASRPGLSTTQLRPIGVSSPTIY